eukprot:3622015-Amphidinium_carterae.1
MRQRRCRLISHDHPLTPPNGLSYQQRTMGGCGKQPRGIGKHSHLLVGAGRSISRRAGAALCEQGRARRPLAGFFVSEEGSESCEPVGSVGDSRCSRSSADSRWFVDGEYLKRFSAKTSTS